MRARPVVPPPPLESIGGLGFYPDEEDEYAAIVRTPYAALDALACRWVATEAETFLPADHIRYFAPALVAWCRRAPDTSYIAYVLAALCKALPFADAAALAAELRALLPEFAPRRFSHPIAFDDPWQASHGCDLIPGRVAMMILTLDPGALDLAALARQGTGPMAIVELGFGVFSRGWQPTPAPGFPPWFADQLLAALHRVARGEEPHAALGAQFVCGDVGPEVLPGCDSLACKAHR